MYIQSNRPLSQQPFCQNQLDYSTKHSGVCLKRTKQLRFESTGRYAVHVSIRRDFHTEKSIKQQDVTQHINSVQIIFLVVM